MNIYGLFRVIIQGAPLSDGEHEDAKALIDQLERVNAFGSISKITQGTHEFVPASGAWANPEFCAYCQKREGEHNEYTTVL